MFTPPENSQQGTVAVCAAKWTSNTRIIRGPNSILECTVTKVSQATRVSCFVGSSVYYLAFTLHLMPLTAQHGHRFDFVGPDPVWLYIAQFLSFMYAEACIG